MNNTNTKFSLWPAIDLMNGAPVRLTRGAFDSQTKYDVSFDEILTAFASFASGVHIIDLDGASDGQVRNASAVKEILSKTNMPVQLGGGIRSFDAAKSWLDAGVRRVILGTKALKEPDILKRCADIYGPDRIVISADVRHGKIMTKGWTEANDIDVYEFLAQRVSSGFSEFMVTDIERDGTLTGASTGLYKSISEQFPHINLLAAGGVGSLADIEDIKTAGASGAIFGKAYYEGHVSAKELEALAKC